MRIVKNPVERKQEILENAIRVFARKGYDKTSISDIAKEMNISQGLCYRYFASKEEIYDAALDLYADFIVAEHIREWDLEQKTIEEIVSSYCGVVDNFMEAEQENTELFTIFHSGENSKKMHNQLAMAVGSKLVPYVTKVLEKAGENGELLLKDAYATAHFIVFGQVGILMNDSIPREQKNEIIHNTLLEFIRVSKVFEGLPNFMRVCREGFLIFRD